MDQKTLTAQIEKALEDVLNNLELVPELRDSCTYSVLNGGKRIRPRIAVATLLDLGGVHIKQHLQTFCALEFLHCSSLIHDDLPCMDNDDFRRGKPTSHKVYGEAHALLTGDALVAIAFQAISKNAALSVQKKQTLISELAQTYIELCNGQLWDLDDNRRQDSLAAIHNKKTGKLFACSFLFGGVVTNDDTRVYDVLRDLGLEWGIFFQFLDDYLDVVGDPSTRGRPTGSDIKNNRITDVSAASLEAARMRLNDKIASLEETINAPAENIRTILTELESAYQSIHK